MIHTTTTSCRFGCSTEASATVQTPAADSQRHFHLRAKCDRATAPLDFSFNCNQPRLHASANAHKQTGRIVCWTAMEGFALGTSCVRCDQAVIERAMLELVPHLSLPNTACELLGLPVQSAGSIGRDCSIGRTVGFLRLAISARQAFCFPLCCWKRFIVGTADSNASLLRTYRTLNRRRNPDTPGISYC